MKIELQKSEELEKLGELLADMRVCMLTSLDEEYVMISKPMSPQEMCEEGAIWFLTDANSAKVQHLQLMNCSFSNESQGTSVSVSGHGEIVKDRDRIESLWTVFARPWFPDGVETSNLAALKFVPKIAEYWDAPNSKMVRFLAMMASVAAATPIGMGEHGNLNVS